MDRNFVISLIKFMNRLGITQNIEITRSGINRAVPYICIVVKLNYKGSVDYEQHHCYAYKNGKIVYFEGNEVVGLDRSILAYLGNNKDIDNYFDQLARYKAKQFFENNL